MNLVTDPPASSQKKANRAAIRFVVVMVALYLLFSQGNLFMNSVFSEGGRFHNAYLATHFNYIQWIKSFLIDSGAGLIELFGYHVISNESDVLIVGGPHLRVNYSCLGLGVLSFLLAFTLAFPAPIKSKLKLFIAATVLVFALNILRIAGLALVMAVFESQRSNFVYHHEIFNIIVYLFVFALLYFWIRKRTRTKHN